MRIQYVFRLHSPAYRMVSSSHSWRSLTQAQLAVQVLLQHLYYSGILHPWSTRNPTHTRTRWGLRRCNDHFVLTSRATVVAFRKHLSKVSPYLKHGIDFVIHSQKPTHSEGYDLVYWLAQINHVGGRRWQSC